MQEEVLSNSEGFLVLDAGKGRVTLKNMAQNKVIRALERPPKWLPGSNQRSCGFRDVITNVITNVTSARKWTVRDLLKP